MKAQYVETYESIVRRAHVGRIPMARVCVKAGLDRNRAYRWAAGQRPDVATLTLLAKTLDRMLDEQMSAARKAAVA